MLKLGITGKVFFYTLLFLVLVVSIAGAMFARQFNDYYSELRIQNIKDVFDPLRVSFETGSVHEIITAAEDFHNKNQSYDFFIQTAEGEMLYRAVGNSSPLQPGFHELGVLPLLQPVSSQSPTDDSVPPLQSPTDDGVPPLQSSTDDSISPQSGYPGHDMGKTLIERNTLTTGSAMYIIKGSDKIAVPVTGVPFTYMNKDSSVRNMMVSRKDGLVLMATVVGDDDSAKIALYRKIAVAAAIMLIVSALGAMLFARGITGPIKRLALETDRMAALEDVTPAGTRYDEVGQLERAVHNMYGAIKENIAKLECEIEKVKDMESSQRYFFSMASHELKTPIAAVSVLLEGMLAEVGDYKNRTKYLKECMNLMRSQNRIVTELLEIVKLSDDSIKPANETFGLLELIRSMLPEYSALAQQKDQQITVDVGGDIDCFSDRIMMRRALSNILMNAIQNSPEGEEIRIWAVEGELCILNTGISIGADALAHIVEPFFRIDPARSRTSAKSGLGLTIVDRIFNQLGIKYEFKNTPEGVVFIFSIPEKQVDSAH